jgi:hypothetical protein
MKRSSSSLTSTTSSRASDRSACSDSSASHNEGCSAKKLRSAEKAVDDDVSKHPDHAGGGSPRPPHTCPPHHPSRHLSP